MRAAVARHSLISMIRCRSARLGGRETAAIAGAILARMRRTPVLLDGFVVCSAAAVLLALDDAALDHCLAAQGLSAQHRHALLLGKVPLLDLGMRLQVGLLAVGIAAVACHNGMATRAQASRERKNLDRRRRRAANPPARRFRIAQAASTISLRLWI